MLKYKSHIVLLSTPSRYLLNARHFIITPLQPPLRNRVYRSLIQLSLSRQCVFWTSTLCCALSMSWPGLGASYLGKSPHIYFEKSHAARSGFLRQHGLGRASGAFLLRRNIRTHKREWAMFRPWRLLARRSMQFPVITEGAAEVSIFFALKGGCTRTVGRPTGARDLRANG